MKTPDDLEKLSLLLDDDDEEVAVNVIAALLDRQDELGDLPARLQESSNELVRRRAHQLQSAITFRKRRQEFAALLETENVDFFAGLVLLHLLWFDRDSQVSVASDLDKFIAESRRRPLLSLDDVIVARASMRGRVPLSVNVLCDAMSVRNNSQRVLDCSIFHRSMPACSSVL